MKKNTIKLTLLPLLLLIMMAFAVAPMSVSAATGELRVTESGYRFQLGDGYPTPFDKMKLERNLWHYHISENGGPYKIAYCIQYSIPANTGDVFNKQDVYAGLSTQQKTWLNRCLMFGYNETAGPMFGGTWSQHAIATQCMAWIISSGYFNTASENLIRDGILGNNPTAMNIYLQMREQVMIYDVIPSFCGSSSTAATSHELEYNRAKDRYELTLTDNNDVLQYFDFSGSGVTFTKNGNKLTISSSVKLEDVVFTATKKLPTDKLPNLVYGVPAYWTHDTQQHLTSLTPGTPESVTACLKLKTEKVGQVGIKKVSEDGIIEGLRFRVIGPDGLDETVVTKADGTIPVPNLVAGQYTITEINTPNRYVQPASQTITLLPGELSSVTFNNILKKFHIYITKLDVETGDAAQSDATLDGAEYAIYDSSGKLVDSVKATGTMAKSKLLVLGTYTIVETKPPTGYTLNSTPITVRGDFEGQTVEIGRADTSIADRVIKGQVAVVKFADAPLTGDREDGGVKRPLAGVEFTFTLKSSGKAACKIVTDADGHAITPLLPYGTYTVTETRGIDGYRKIEPFDVFIATDSKIYKYILENKVYTADVKIFKVDAETKKPIPLTGTQFKIKDANGEWITQSYNYPKPTTLDTFETADDGSLILPEPLRAGQYELYEVQAPYGYTIDTEPISFEIPASEPSTMIGVIRENRPVKGVIVLRKTGETLAAFEKLEDEEHGIYYQPIYETGGLPGAVFDIIAAEDIVTPDGTVRAAAGEVVDTVTTKTWGFGKSKELYLGEYQIVERSVPEGFVLDAEPKSIELKYKDQETAVVHEYSDVFNDRQKVAVSLLKEAELEEGQTYSPYGDILFGLYAQEDIVSPQDGDTVILEKGSLIEFISLNDEGRGVIGTDLPFGTYYVQEIAAGEGYILNDAIYKFEFTYQGPDTVTVEIPLNGGETISNEMMRGTIRITKTAEGIEDDLSGFEFRVYGTSLTGVAYDEVVASGVDGTVEIENLLVGEYMVTEVENDQTVGYILPEAQTIAVGHDETTKVIIENRLIKGAVKIIKTDHDGDRLNGATFGLYNAEDELVQEFTVSQCGEYTVEELLYGEYYLRELAAPIGYELNEEKYPFTIEEHEQLLEITIVNEKIPELEAPSPGEPPQGGENPKTGDDRQRPFIPLLGSLIGITAIGSYLIYKRFKMKR